MKIKLLLLLFLITSCQSLFSQLLYSSTTEVGSRFNPGLGKAGTPIIAFDDVSIADALFTGNDSIVVTKVKVGIRRTPGAPAADVKIYYTPFDDTSTGANTNIKIPPVLLGTVSLSANASSLSTTIVSVGDSISPLFSVKANEGIVYPGYHTFFIGASISNNNSGNALRITSGPTINKDYLWMYDADSTMTRYTGKFDNFVATFYTQVFGGKPSLLPVTFSSFTGEQKTTGVNLLTWQTETEINNKGFELQRSMDGVAFTKLTFIDTKAINGNSAGKLSYQYLDEKPLGANNYYRLQQVDKDGRFNSSAVVLLQNKQATVELVNVYPNPVRSTLNVSIASAFAGRINITISDLEGKVLIKRSEKMATGVTKLSFNVSKLSAGTYIMKATNESNASVFTYKLIKE